MNKNTAVCIALLLALVAAPSVFLPSVAHAQDTDKKATGAGAGTSDGALEESLYDCPEKARKGKYVVSLKPETTLDDLIKWAMTFHCKNFVYSSEIGKRSSKVTIMTPKNMSARQAWRVFLVALQSMNLTVVPKGNVLEIIETSKAKSQPLPIFTKGRAPNSSQLVRVVLRPQHLSVDDLAKVLQELKSTNGQVTAITKAGIVMVSDMGTNVSKMADLMLTVNQPVVGERLYMLKVQYADATELATKLTDILGTKEAPTAQGATSKAKKPKKGRKKDISRSEPKSIGDSEVQAAVPSKIIADERINSLIILGSEAAYLRVRALVRRLDVGIDVEGAGRIHVYRLEHSKAEEMGQTLTSVINGISQPPANARGNRAKPARPTANANSAAAFEGQVRVTHDQPTNSIVAVASVKDFLALRDVIRKLDIPRPQVYIEANIVEVGVNNSSQFGTSWHGGKDVGDGSLIIGGVQHTDLTSLNPASLASSTGLLGGALGPLLSNSEQILQGLSIPSFGVLFNALANASNVNVLSSPHILTTDNEEAEISVGENIPYQSSVGVGGAGNPFAAATQSIQRQDVALTLKITPHINASSMVRLEIDLEISDIASKDFEGLGPSWAKRTIKDTVVVRDQQAVVIGGLMSDKKISSESKVPLLGDIPVLGALLFKYQTKSTEKRNLLVVLTPHIVHNQMDIERLLEKRTREQREFSRTFSTFKTLKYRSDIDYRRKRGVLEEINREVKAMERDVQLRRELDADRVRIPDGEIEYFTGEEDEEGSSDEDDSSEEFEEEQ